MQRYILEKGIQEPEEGSTGWVFVELYRPSITTAVEHATAYEKRIREYCRRLLQSSRANHSPGRTGVVAGRTVNRGIKASSKEQDLNSPQKGASEMPNAGSIFRNQLFISYSHKDEKFLAELRAHLRPFERTERVSVWSDKQIQPGSKWLTDIRRALAESRVALLLVTKDFLASDFIHKNELGPLLQEAERGGVRILWVLVRACSYKQSPLKDYQAAISPAKPLAEMKAERDNAWVQICEEISRAFQSPTPNETADA